VEEVRTAQKKTKKILTTHTQMSEGRGFTEIFGKDGRTAHPQPCQSQQRRLSFHQLPVRSRTTGDVEGQDDSCALFGSCKFVTVANCSFSPRLAVFRFGGGVAENVAVSN
jgi:hypothetical protein